MYEALPQIMADVSLNTGELLQARHLATEYAVSRLLAEGGECGATLRRALAIMGQKLGFAYCVCWRLTENAGCMRVAANWQRHPERTERVARAGQGIEIRPGHGFAGRAWQAASPLWIDDLGSDADFLAADEARAAGLAAAVCCPIFARSQVIGLLQLIASAGAPPESDSLPVLVSLAAQIGQFLDRDAMGAALAASELRYRALFEENIAGVHLSTLEGKALAANPAFLRLLGYASEQEALEADSRELYVNINDRTALMEELRQNGRDLNRQIQLRRNDGTTIWVLANTVLIRGGEGVPDLNETTLIDITESKELERRTWQTTKLEGIGRLAAGIAHDFNNLLTVINGYSDMLLAKLDATNPSQPSIAKIRQAGRRAEALTQQLMAFSRQQAVQPAVVDLNAAVQECLDLLRPTLGETVHVTQIAESGLGAVHADPGQIHQVVMNLVMNARDAMPQGGKLTMELNQVEVDAAYTRRHVQARTGSFVRLAVSDTGTGMDPETRNHAFEPFFTTKRGGKGHGLGLATVYGLVLQNGGWIELYSELGHGTTFKIYFPRATVAAAVEAVSGHRVRSLTPTEAGRVAVMIAEDEAVVRGLLEDVLTEAGYRVVCSAADGTMAMGLVESAQLDLLVTDVIMPGLTGPELAERLWLRQPDTRVLFISGYTEQAVYQQGLLPPRRTGVDYLQKPFSPEMLQAKVAELLGGGGNHPSP